MAFDGVVIANIVYDMNRLLTGGRIYKIYQPEADELLLVVKNNKETYRLLISAGASLPLIYFYYKDKGESYDRPKLLYAASKIYQQRKNYRNHTAWDGENCRDHHRAFK